MKQFGFDIIGTHLDISIDTDDSIIELTQLIESRLSIFEQKYSRFISGNWLYTLNQERIGILDSDTRIMLMMMLEIAKNTDGYFDPTVGKRLTELGYGNQGRMKNEEGRILGKGFGDYRDIELIGEQVILHGDIELEFGGIGKGYLIDLIRSIIIDYKLKIKNSETDMLRFLINFGGDMYGSGNWNIGLESPFASDEVIGTIILDDLFLACSAGTRRKWGDHHHLINPHTGESARDVIASYIEGGSGIISDGYATALCVMPWDLACRTLAKTPEISGVLVSKEGNIYQKEGSRSEVFE